MATRSRKKWVAGLVLLLAVAIFVPPNINRKSFSKHLAPALSAALGHQVEIGSVSFRLLPRPGFDLHDFKVMDDPAFSQEPMLQCGEVTADLRFSALWQGRLEIADLELRNDGEQPPPSLNLVYWNGHWNLESLLLRAGQVPSAPTTIKHPEERYRFPYIGAEDGRINIKVGPEKKPYTFTNADFAFWLEAEDHWHFRLEGKPTRTDMALSDTGTIRMEGDLNRSTSLSNLPMHGTFEWTGGQLGQLSRFASGQDKGWRGGLQLNVQFSGSPADLHLDANAELRNFRRFDIDRNQMPVLQSRCLGEYMSGALQIDCEMPAQTGTVKLTGDILPGMQSMGYDLLATAEHIPLSLIATTVLHSKRGLPDDLSASGTLDAAFELHSHAPGLHVWLGQGSTSPFVLSSSVTPLPLHVGALEFQFGAPPAIAHPHSHARTAAFPADALVFEPFKAAFSTADSMQLAGYLAPSGYEVSAQGNASVAHLLELGELTGFRASIPKVTGKAQFSLSANGAWTNFAPAVLSGTAELQGIRSFIPGIRDALLLSSADLRLTGNNVVLTNLQAGFEHSPVRFTGSVSRPRHCLDVKCPFSFDLHASTVTSEALGGLLSVKESRWRIPFFSSSPRNLPDFRASGTLSIGTLKLGTAFFKMFSAHAEVADRTLQLRQVHALLGNGSATGSWTIAWHREPPVFSGSGDLTGVSLDQVLSTKQAALPGLWIAGKTDLKYSLRFSGQTSTDMLESLTGKLDLIVPAGSSRLLLVGNDKLLKFNELHATAQVKDGIVTFSPSKFRAGNRIYQLSGTFSLPKKQADFKVTSDQANWNVTGPLGRPTITAKPGIAREASAQ